MEKSPQYTLNIFIKLKKVSIIGVNFYIVVVAEDFVFSQTFHIKFLLLNLLDFFSGKYCIKEFIFQISQNEICILLKFLVIWHRSSISSDCYRMCWGDDDMRKGAEADKKSTKSLVDSHPSHHIFIGLCCVICMSVVHNLAAHSMKTLSYISQNFPSTVDENCRYTHPVMCIPKIW